MSSVNLGEVYMAADDKSKPGGGFLNQGGSNPGASNPPDQAAKDARRERKKSLDTQSLKVLAPRSEVARSALEMRQNLEKFMPPGPQRDQLIAQLKEDVTPLLRPELEKGQAQSKSVVDERLDREQKLNEAIERAASLIKGHLGQFETFGPVREVVSVASAVIEHMRAVLHDPRRGKGEFQIAIGIKDKKFYSTSRYFEPSAVETFAYERQTTEGLSDLQVSGYKIAALIHAHQSTGDRDAAHFSNADIEQSDGLQATYPEVGVQSFLLTPAPENHLLVYSPNIKDKQPLGEVVGFFAANGNFQVRNAKYIPAFKDTKLIVS
jgi:hypothetical protein